MANNGWCNNFEYGSAKKLRKKEPDTFIYQDIVRTVVSESDRIKDVVEDYEREAFNDS